MRPCAVDSTLQHLLKGTGCCRESCGVPWQQAGAPHVPPTRREYVDKTVEKWGRIDILVNNAAFQGPAKDSFADIERERLEFTFKTSARPPSPRAPGVRCPGRAFAGRRHHCLLQHRTEGREAHAARQRDRQHLLDPGSHGGPGPCAQRLCACAPPPSADAHACCAADAQHPGLRLHKGEPRCAGACKVVGRVLTRPRLQGAIVTFTKGLSAELAKKTIRVNVIAPGPVWTPLIPASLPPLCAGACRLAPLCQLQRCTFCLLLLLLLLRLSACALCPGWAAVDTEPARCAGFPPEMVSTRLLSPAPRCTRSCPQVAAEHQLTGTWACSSKSSGTWRPWGAQVPGRLPADRGCQPCARPGTEQPCEQACPGSTVHLPSSWQTTTSLRTSQVRERAGVRLTRPALPRPAWAAAPPSLPAACTPEALAPCHAGP